MPLQLIHSMCARMHQGFHRYLQPHKHHKFAQQLGARTWDMNLGYDFKARVTQRAGQFMQDHPEPEEEMRSYNGAIETFVQDIFQDVNWDVREPLVRKRLTQKVRRSMNKAFWAAIDRLRSASPHVGRKLRALEQQIQELAQRPPLNWDDKAREIALAAAADVATAVFPVQCRHHNFHREQGLQPPIVMPANMVAPHDQRVLSAVADSRGELDQLEHLRPRPRRDRAGQTAGVPYPSGVPKAELLGRPPRERLDRTKSI